MSGQFLSGISLAILFIPLIGFALIIFSPKRFEKAHYMGVGAISAAFLLSVFVMISKLSGDYGKIVSSFVWFDLGSTETFGHLKIELGTMIDNITVIMLFVVNLISMLVHFFSLGYMKGDKRFNRYFAYLGIFTFSMLGIVLTHNLLMMYIFWELVGLSSYLLIGFWFEKKSASDASKKAFLVNRVGDIGMFIGILILFFNYGTFTFDDIYGQIAAGNLPFESTTWLTAAGILIFMGAVGKSAQFPLHVWLPDAMEGPTPVSALIHAATMVAAGVYLSVRIFVMLTADAMLVIAVVGAFTSFIAATIALTQNDIKKVLAYSTVSQLGYMVMAIGTGAYVFAFFHLVTHAFFKACLFLGSGSVIHSMHHNQDISVMGGLRKKMPVTYITFLVSTLAISGIPFTSGFLSKDGILAGSLAFGELTGHWLIPIMAFAVALMTAFYMFRLVIKTFHGKPRNQELFDHAHESPAVMSYPLIVLSVLSIFFFYTYNPFSADAGWFAGRWIETPATVVPAEASYEFMITDEPADVHSDENAGHHNNSHHVVHSEMYTEAMHSVHYPAMFLSLFMAGGGILIAFFMYEWRKSEPKELTGIVKSLHKLSYNKWYIDEIYDATVIRFTLWFSDALAWFDAKVVDGAVNGSAFVTQKLSDLSGLFDKYVVDGLVNFTAFLSGALGFMLRKVQTGRVQTYIALVIFSLLVLLIIFQ